MRQMDKRHKNDAMPEKHGVIVTAIGIQRSGSIFQIPPNSLFFGFVSLSKSV